MPGKRTRTCSHRFVNGDACGAIAMTGEDHCYFHLRYKASNDPAGEDYELPLLEDRETVQLVVRDIMRGILNGTLEGRKASQLLYAIQIASNNLARWDKIANGEEKNSDPEEPRQPVMLKFLGETFAGANVANGADTGKPVAQVLARNMPK